MGIIVLIIILGAAIGIITVFIIRSILAPKRIATLAALIKQNKTTQAIKVAKQIIAKEPRNPDAHYLLGLAYLDDSKPELALMEFRTVNQIGQFDGYTKEVPFRNKIAELYTNFNQPEEALKEYLLLVKKDPENPDYYVRIATLFEERDRSDKAFAYYKKALELNPRQHDANLRMGMLMYRAKKGPEAREYLEAALKEEPESYATFYYLGKIQKEAKDLVSALSSFEKATKDPEFKVKALVERGACYLSSGNIDRAIMELERATNVARDDSAPEVLYGRYFLAAAYERTRKIEQAIQQWEKIYAKKNNFRDVAEKLSQYQELRTDDRVKDFLTCGQEEYAEMCRKLTVAMGLSVREVEETEGGCQVTGVEAQSKWRNARKLPTLLRFLRVTEMVDEASVRSLHEEMKKQNITRGAIITSSSFSRMALNFVESRPIDLHGKERLQSLLKQIDA